MAITRIPLRPENDGPGRTKLKQMLAEVSGEGVASLGLSVRQINSLESKGIFNIFDLLRRTRAKLLEINDITRDVLDKGIMPNLEKRGLFAANAITPQQFVPVGEPETYEQKGMTSPIILDQEPVPTAAESGDTTDDAPATVPISPALQQLFDNTGE
jgi:hypothetical protein